MKEAGAHTTFWVTSPPLRGHRRVRRRPHAHVPSRHGHRPHGHRSPHERVRPVRSGCWDVDNVLVADSSVFPTSTGYGPTLTIVATALAGRTLLAARTPDDAAVNIV